MKYFTFKEAASYVGVSRATLYRWTHTQNLHYIRSGSISRIAEDELDNFMHSEDFKI